MQTVTGTGCHSGIALGRGIAMAYLLQQFRLFFRYDTQSRIIIYGWVNDESTKRAYGSRTDAYRIFQKRLTAGDPPTDWNDLIKRTAPADQQ